MGLLYCLIAALLGELFAQAYIAPNIKVKVILLILLPAILNLCISLLAALFVQNSLEYGYNVGGISGTLCPATLVMMIVLGFRITLKKNIMEKCQENNDVIDKRMANTENKNMLLSSTNSVEWWKKLVVLIIIIIAFLFALNGRYSYLADGIILDKWAGRAFFVDKLLDE